MGCVVGKFIDLTGQRFGNLVVVRQTSRGNRNRIRWLCVCDCKKEKVFLSSNLTSNHTRSCGCLLKEKTKQRFTKHGHTKNRETTIIYRIWADMIQRCINPNSKNYLRYGGRGITVCRRWEDSFENFLEDMGEAPRGLQLDRINNDKGYCKENCRWATRKEQARNTRTNRLIICFGKTQCIAAWSEETGILHETLRKRIYLLNWPIKKALTTPVKEYKKRKSDGKN